MITVYDNFLAWPDRYREFALEQPFAETLGFKGIAPVDHTRDKFVKALQAALPLPFTVNTSFFRKSPVNQSEPNFIHNDESMGHYTAILYLSYTHPATDGTDFWRSTATSSMIGDFPNTLNSHDLSKWSKIKQVPMRFNRAVVFDSRLYHSRSLFENFGEGDGSRLIQTVFFSV